jgi:cystathionine gamma-synthase
MMRRPELNPGSCLFYGTGEEDDLNALESVLKAQKAERDSTTGPVRKVAAVFAEFPTNPLLKCTDLKRLSRWALEYDFLLIVDDTISGYSNTDLLHTPDACVDIVCSSLTKAFSGTGDVLAGAVVVNSHGRYASQLRDVVQYSLALPRVYRLDALVLERNSRDYAERCGKMSSNARALSEWLLRHPSVRSVHYPGLSEASTCTGVDGVVAMNDTAAVSHARYTALLRADNPTAGYGCLFSVLFKENVNVEAFYDVIDLHKGPSLGTNFTLISPYTLLAHYCELDWAASYGVEKELIRVSAGTEDTADLIAHFSMAIVAATHRYRST